MPDSHSHWFSISEAGLLNKLYDIAYARYFFKMVGTFLCGCDLLCKWNTDSCQINYSPKSHYAEIERQSYIYIS